MTCVRNPELLLQFVALHSSGLSRMSRGMKSEVSSAYQIALPVGGAGACMGRSATGICMLVWPLRAIYLFKFSVTNL